MKKIITFLIIVLTFVSCKKIEVPVPTHFRLYWELHQYEDESKPVISLTYIGIIDSSERKAYDTILRPLPCTVRDSAKWVFK